jgi:hypothetical protein
LSVRTAEAGGDLYRHHREAPLRLSRQRCRSNRIRTLDGAKPGAGGARQHKGPRQGAIRGKLVLKAGQLLQSEFARRKLVEVAVRGGDKVVRRKAVKARLGPETVNTILATITAVARFGPPPATALSAASMRQCRLHEGRLEP